MTFISDSQQLRTWDPDKGIELKWDEFRPDGEIVLRLVGPSSTVRFTMNTTYDPPVAEPRNDKLLIIRHVNFPDRALDGFTIEETKALIEEALQAFKGIHGKFPDNRVQVVFT